VVRDLLRSDGPLALLAACVAGGAILALGVLLGWWRDEQPEPVVTGVQLSSALLAPQEVRFGDPVEASLGLVVSGSAAEPGAIEVAAAFDPYVVVGRPSQTRADAGGTTRLTFRFRLECLEIACLGADRSQLELPAARVVAAATGETLLRVGWPPLTIGSRIASSDLRAEALPWRDSATSLDTADYAIGPSLAFWLLLTGGIAMLLGGVGIAARLLGVSLLAGLRKPGRSPLEEALALARHAADRGEARAKRRALERLASELRRGDREELATAAIRLAWSEELPEREAMLALVGRAEAAGE
jgi:hypothetical protein